MHRKALPATLVSFTLLLCATARGQEACEAPSPDCATVGQWDLSLSLGAGTRTNPVGNGSDIPLLVIPQISYYGKRFFLENLEVGFALHEGGAHTFNLIATPGYDRVFFYRSDPQNIFIPFGPSPATEVRVRRPHTTVLMGPEWLFYRDGFVGQVDALYEVTGEHKGYEVRAALGAPLMRAPGALTASAGFTWKSTELVSYYYGVDGAYAPDAAFNPFLKLAYSRPLSERWTLRAYAHYEHLDDAIAESPIVSDKGVTTVFAGFVLKIF